MEPIEQMLRMGAQIALQLARAFLTIREEHELLVVPQALAAEHRGQVPPGLRVVALDEAEALGGTDSPTIATKWVCLCCQCRR